MTSSPIADAGGAKVPLVSGDGLLKDQNRGAAQLLAARVCFMASGYLVSLLLARGLGPEQYGIYGVIISVLVWVETASAAGIPGATARLLTTEDARDVESAAFSLILGASAALFAIAFIGSWFLADLFGIAEGAFLFQLAILDIPLNGVYLAYQGILAGRREFGTFSVAVVIYGLGKLVSVIGVLLISGNVAGALIANALATCFAVGFLLWKSPPRGIIAPRSMLVGMVTMALPMGFYLVANQILLNLDLWTLKALRPNQGEMIGFYVAAANIGKLLTAVPSVLTVPFFAALAWRIAQGETTQGRLHIAQAVRVASLAIVPGAILLAVNAQEVLGLLFSSTYGGGGVFLAFMVIGFGIFALFDIFFHALMAIGRQQLVALILLALIIAVLGLDLLLIPALGGVGAALAMSVGMALGTVIAAVLAARVFGSIFPLASLARISACGVVVGLLSAAIPTQGVLVGIEVVAMLLLYSVLLLLSRELTWKELMSPFHSR